MSLISESFLTCFHSCLFMKLEELKMGEFFSNTTEFSPLEKEGMSKIVCDQLMKLTSCCLTKRFLRRLILLQELSDVWLNDDDVRLIVVKKPANFSTTETLQDFSTETSPTSMENKDENDAHQNGELSNQFCCEHCGVLFETSSLLNRHARSHSTVKRPLFKCRDCAREFTRAEGLKRHMTTHSGEKPCICSNCGKQFSRLDHLVLHMRIHTGERPYTCSECGKHFSAGPHLKKHIGMHEKETPYVCNCHGHGFPSIEAIRLHFEEMQYIVNV